MSCILASQQNACGSANHKKQRSWQSLYKSRGPGSANHKKQRSSQSCGSPKKLCGHTQDTEEVYMRPPQKLLEHTQDIEEVYVHICWTKGRAFMHFCSSNFGCLFSLPYSSLPIHPLFLSAAYSPRTRASPTPGPFPTTWNVWLLHEVVLGY